MIRPFSRAQRLDWGGSVMPVGRDLVSIENAVHLCGVSSSEPTCCLRTESFTSGVVMLRVIWVLVFTPLLLAGCQSSPDIERVSDLTRDLRQKQVSFVLQQDVTIPAARSRVFLQDGGIVGGRNLYRPHCSFEIDSVDHTGFPIAAEIFDVVRIQRSTVQIASQSTPEVASLSVASGIGLRINSDRFHDGYHFWLQSDRQPMVRRLTCYGVFARPADLRAPTLGEINAALGDVGVVQVQGEDD